jgi:hypothetical protein
MVQSKTVMNTLQQNAPGMFFAVDKGSRETGVRNDFGCRHPSCTGTDNNGIHLFS